jgi:DNA-directed RNA polymerase subunit RPC12/RpoP
MKKAKAIELLKLAVPIKALTQQEYVDFVEAVNMGMDALEQTEPHEGHWIPHESPDGGEQYECSRCGVLWEFNDGTPEDNEAYFCPKCGARMKGEI